MPVIAEPALSSLQLADIICAELLTPPPNRFIGYEDAPFGQKIFNVTEAQTEAMIDPYGVANDLRRETVSVVTGSGAVREISLSVCRPS